MLFHLVIVWCCFDHGILVIQARTTLTPNVCPPGNFRDGSGRCRLCRQCDDFSIELSPCGPYSDTQCLACVGDQSMQHPECRRCPPCGKGQFLVQKCTQHNLTVCQTCPPGSYNAKTSYATVCAPCTSCYRERRPILQGCTSTSDVTCGHCAKGDYFERRKRRCISCKKCDKRGIRMVIHKCLMDETGRECGMASRYVHDDDDDDDDDEDAYSNVNSSGVLVMRENPGLEVTLLSMVVVTTEKEDTDSVALDDDMKGLVTIVNVAVFMAIVSCAAITSFSVYTRIKNRGVLWKRHISTSNFSKGMCPGDGQKKHYNFTPSSDKGSPLPLKKEMLISLPHQSKETTAVYEFWRTPSHFL